MITKRVLKFVQDGMEYFEKPGASEYYAEFRRDEPKYLDLILFKMHYYYGRYALYEGGVFVATFDPNLFDKPTDPAI